MNLLPVVGRFVVSNHRCWCLRKGIPPCGDPSRAVMDVHVSLGSHGEARCLPSQLRWSSHPVAR